MNFLLTCVFYKNFDRYHKQQLTTSVWAVIEDRKLVYQRKLVGKNYIKEEIEHRLDYYKPNWRKAMDVAQWEEEYKYAMNNVRIIKKTRCNLTCNNTVLFKKERNKLGQILSAQLLETYCRSFDQLPSEDQTNIGAILKGYAKQEDIMDAWLQTQDDSLRLYECLGHEFEKQKVYEVFLFTRKVIELH